MSDTLPDLARPQSFRATDGYALEGTVFGDPARARATLVVAGATGVPAAFYRRFAEHAATRGFAAVTFDYRGIGASKRGRLRGFQASFLDWAEQDLAAVAAWSCARGPTAVVGHSFGGHAFGLLPDANTTLGLYTFGTSAGWGGHMPLDERAKAWLLWHVVGPATTAALGYLPSRRLGLGESLPYGVYRQWKTWCRHPDYFFGNPDLGPLLRARFAEVIVPCVAVNASDDCWAPPRSARAFMAGYTHSEVVLRVVAPRLGPIAHMGYFRPEQAWLWDEALDWASERTATRVQRA